MKTLKKALKAKKIKKDYQKKLNIKKNNWPKKIGGRKLAPIVLGAGDGILPKSRKVTPKKPSKE